MRSSSAGLSRLAWPFWPVWGWASTQTAAPSAATDCPSLLPVSMVATSRPLDGSTRQTRPAPVGSDPTTQTPLGPAATPTGWPGRRILAATWLVAGSTRMSVPAVSGRGAVWQHTAQTPVALTAIGGSNCGSGTWAATWAAAGSMRTSPIPGTEPQTTPGPIATSSTQVVPALLPVPTTFATGSSLRGSTRVTVHAATQTEVGSALIAVMLSENGMVAMTARRGVAGASPRAGAGAAAPPPGPCLSVRPESRPASSNTSTTTAAPAALTRKRRDSIGMHHPGAL